MIHAAFDLGGRTGWAIRYDTGDVRCGTWTLTRGNLGGRRSILPAARLWRRLWRLSLDHQVAGVVFEETFTRGEAQWRLAGLQQLVMLWAYQLGAPWQRVSPTAWKKACLGRGHVDRRAYFQAAREVWPELRITTDDAAAALWLLDYGEKARNASAAA